MLRRTLQQLLVFIKNILHRCSISIMLLMRTCVCQPMTVISKRNLQQCKQVSTRFCHPSTGVEQLTNMADGMCVMADYKKAIVLDWWVDHEFSEYISILQTVEGQWRCIWTTKEKETK